MLNSLQLMGRLTNDPAFRQTTSGVPCARFTLAVDRPYKKDQQNQKADFIRCVAWRETAEFIARNFAKGNLVAVEGRLQTDQYTDNTGNRRESTEVVVNNVHVTGERRQQAQPQQDETAPPDIGDFADALSSDDLPFT